MSAARVEATRRQHLRREPARGLLQEAVMDLFRRGDALPATREAACEEAVGPIMARRRASAASAALDRARALAARM